MFYTRFSLKRIWTTLPTKTHTYLKNPVQCLPQVMSERLVQLEKMKAELEKKVKQAEREKDDLGGKVKNSEKEKLTLGQKVKVSELIVRVATLMMKL